MLVGCWLWGVAWQKGVGGEGGEGVEDGRGEVLVGGKQGGGEQCYDALGTIAYRWKNGM